MVPVKRLDVLLQACAVLRDRGIDFELSLVGDGPQLNLDEASFRRAVQTFGTALQGADVGLFYYAGHGVQVRGGNYLVPVGANPAREMLTDGHIGKLIDGPLREILSAPRPQPQVNDKVQEDMKAHFESLGQELGRSGPFGGNSLSETTREFLSPQIEEFALKQAILKARENEQDLGSPDVQKQIAENARQMAVFVIGLTFLGLELIFGS